MRKLTVILPAILFLCLIGCGSNQPLQMTAIQLGRTVNSDHTVGGFTTTFTPDDSIYLAVLTGGAGSGTIRVRWKYGEHVIDEPKKQVSYNQAAATDFVEWALPQIPDERQRHVVTRDREGATADELIAELGVSRANLYKLRQRGHEALARLKEQWDA